MSRHIKTAACAAAAAIAMVAMTGCGILIEEGVERGIEEAAEADGENVDVDLDSEDGGFVVESEDGSFSVGGDLPESFPPEIPLLEGDVLSASAMQSGGSSGWSVQIQAGDAGAFDAAEQALREAGFTEGEESFSLSSAEMQMITLADDRWQVLLGSIEGENVVSYTVTELP